MTNLAGMGSVQSSSRDELGRLLQATESESCDLRAMIWLSATTGMRFGEVSALTWDDKGVVHVRRSQVEGKVYPTKTSTERSVPLTDVAVLLQDHRERLEHQRFKRADGLVFPSRAGTNVVAAAQTSPSLRCESRHRQAGDEPGAASNGEQSHSPNGR